MPFLGESGIKWKTIQRELTTDICPASWHIPVKGTDLKGNNYSIDRIQELLGTNTVVASAMLNSNGTQSFAAGRPIWVVDRYIKFINGYSDQDVVNGEYVENMSDSSDINEKETLYPILNTPTFKDESFVNYPAYSKVRCIKSDI